MAPWRFDVHPGLEDDVASGPTEEYGRILGALEGLVAWLDRRGHVRPWLFEVGVAFAARSDVRPLTGATTPSSFRLRCGSYRVAFLVAANDHTLVATAAARWDSMTMAGLIRRHEHRLRRR